MGHFSREEIEEIVRRLATYGKKDTEFETASDPSDDDIVAIVQDFENKKISLADIRRYFGAPYLPLDGSSAMEGDLDMGDHNIKNVADPSLSHHAANKDYVDGVESELDSEISNIDGRVQGIEDVIPSSADPDTNQLADKAWVSANHYNKSETYTKSEVDQKIQTETAEFKGTYDTWSDISTNRHDFPGEKVDNNDYIVVLDSSGYESSYKGTWRFKYSGSGVYSKDNWLPEYQINEEPLTPEQLAAINSGITSTKVGKLDALPTNSELQTELSGKQATLIDSGAGKNFKKINGQSLLGSGDDIVISSVASGYIHNSTPLYIDLDLSPTTFLLNGTDSSSGKEFCYLIKTSDLDMGSETFNSFVLLAGDDVLTFTVGSDDFGDILLQISASNDTLVNFMSLTSIAAEFYELQGSFTSSQTVTPAILQQKLVSGTNIKTINGTSLLGSGNIQISADTSNCVKFGEAINASNGYLTIYGDETFALMLVVVLDDEVSTYIVRGNQSPTVSAEKIEGIDSFQYAIRGDGNGTLALYHEDSLTVTPILLSGTMPIITDLASASGEEKEIQSFQIGKELPSGGTAGQVLSKASGTDYDVEWANGGGGGDTSDCVKYTQQSKTDNEKTTARTNIDAVGSPSINNIIELTQAEYDALPTKDQTAVYLVTDPSPSTESQNVGIANIETQRSLVSGGTNVTTITLTNGNSYDIKIKNGEQGNTGSSVNYPYELVNNLTTDDATKGLSAAQGVVLEEEISQIAAKVNILSYIIVEEDGLYFVDENYYIGAYLDEDGLHAPNISNNSLDYEIV